MSVFIKINGANYNTVEYDIPSDRAFREAWSVDTENSVITVDLEKAKDLWREKIRDARKSKFTELDAEYMKALETNGDTSLIISEKQNLRNAPNDENINSANSVEALKFIQPLAPAIIIK